MLKRAYSCVIVAIIAAIFGFTGLLQWTAIIAQSVFFVCFAVCLLSLLFSLFEEPSETDVKRLPLETEIRH
jgi:uncharacterized membrane protein YtjA (UPF0391 family)